MPMIDIYLPENIAPDKDQELAQRVVTSMVRHEGFGDPAPAYVQRISTAYIHRMPKGAVHTIATADAEIVRIHATFHPGGLDTERMRAFIAEATSIVADIADDPELLHRTWVTLSETVEGGWGVDGKSIRDRP